MATTVATEVSNRYASPPSKNPVGIDGGRVRIAMGTIALAAADIDADGDIVLLAQLPAQARLISIKVACDTLDTGTDVAFNCGLYEPTTDGSTAGTLVDENVYASAVALGQSAAGSAFTELLGESLDTDVMDGFGEQLYETAGDAQGEFAHYDIALTQTAAASGATAGDLAYQILYSID